MGLRYKGSRLWVKCLGACGYKLRDQWFLRFRDQGVSGLGLESLGHMVLKV